MNPTLPPAVPLGAAIRAEIGAHTCALIQGTGNRITGDVANALVLGIQDIYAAHGIVIELDLLPDTKPEPAKK